MHSIYQGMCSSVIVHLMPTVFMLMAVIHLASRNLATDAKVCVKKSPGLINQQFPDENIYPVNK